MGYFIFVSLQYTNQHKENMDLTELKNLIISNKNDFEVLLKENGCYGYLGDYKGKYDYSKLEIDEDGYIIMDILRNPEILNWNFISVLKHEDTGKKMAFLGAEIYIYHHLESMD